MSELEFFGGMGGADKMDPASFEKFKERIQAAAAQIAALKIGEQKQRKKEEKLIQILLKFVKTGTKKDIMLLIARLLEQNVPPLFILSIVSLGNEDLKKELAEEEKLTQPQNKQLSGEITRELQKEENSLSLFGKDESLPLKVRIEIDAWLKYVFEQAFEDPFRLMQTALDSEKSLILPIIQLPAFILRDFLEKYNQQADYEKLKEFTEFFLNGVMSKVEDKIKEQKNLKESSD
jgi:uncharacterized protein YdiU (UPF0061 family)